MSEVNELLSVSLINKVMAKGGTIFIFTSGVLRGKLSSATTARAVPSPDLPQGPVSTALVQEATDRDLRRPDVSTRPKGPGKGQGPSHLQLHQAATDLSNTGAGACREGPPPHPRRR